MAHWRNHITVDPNICHGKACISGTRVLVSVILDNLAAGIEEAEILRQYPSVTSDDIHAVLAYPLVAYRQRLVQEGQQENSMMAESLSTWLRSRIR